jgi:WD40 repeat protein
MALQTQWRKGPLASVECQPAHGQPVFSMAVGRTSFVTGSADHGLREYSLDSGKYLRELFAKKYGHKEWVSTCSYTPSGRIISGGMDSVVCFWESKAVKCDHFIGHR